MKISRFTKLIILLLLLWEIKFFYLIPFPSFISQLNNEHQKIIIVLIVIFTILCVGRILFSQSKLIFASLVFIFLGMYLIEFISSYFTYNQGMLNVFIASNYYLIPFAYFIYSYYLRKTDDIELFKELIINIGFVLCILFLLQYILIKFNIRFLQINFEHLRYGELRIYEAGSSFINLALIFAMSKLLNYDKNKYKLKKYIMFILLAIFNIIFIAKGRMGLVIIVISLVSMILYKYRKHIVKLAISMVTIFILIACFVQTDVAQRYINESKVIDASYTNRMGAINMYVEQIKENPIFGMGCIRDMEGSPATYLLRGYRGTYTRTDVGIIGFTNCFGIFGLLWYMILLLSSIAYIVKIKKNIKYKTSTELIGMFVLIILSSGSLIVMDSGRIFMLPIFMSIIDYMNFKLEYSTYNNI